MTSIAYLLDENVDPRLQRALSQRAPDLVGWRIGDPGAPTLHTDDPTILRWCEENRFSLVTNNRASMPVHPGEHVSAGRHMPGIFILRSPMTLGDIADELVLIYGTSDADEYVDLLRYLPVSR